MYANLRVQFGDEVMYAVQVILGEDGILVVALDNDDDHPNQLGEVRELPARSAVRITADF
jgi:hypothetical protein